MASYKLTIQNKLIDVAKTHQFFRVGYDGRSAYATDEVITPGSIEANEISSSFGESEHRIKYRRERESWSWLLILMFPVEVLLETFEEGLLDTPINIPAVDGLRGIWLEMTSADYAHPPRIDAANGTEARYNFEAKILKA